MSESPLAQTAHADAPTLRLALALKLANPEVGWAPQGKMRPSLLLAAFSHSASVGKTTPPPFSSNFLNGSGVRPESRNLESNH